MHTLLYNYNNVLIYQSHPYFEPQWPIIMVWCIQMYKTIVRPYYHLQYVELSEITNMWFIESDMCAVTGAACTFECFQIAPITVHISESINHTLMNFRKFHILEMIIRFNYYFIHLYAPWLWPSGARNMDEFLCKKTIL